MSAPRDERREDRPDLCPNANHIAPHPVDGPTACPCGRLTRHPAPPPKENRWHGRPHPHH